MQTKNDVWIKQASLIVKDLYERKVSIYYADFFVCYLFGILFLIGSYFSENLMVTAGLFLCTTLVFARLDLFLHEITHITDGSFKYFKILSNGLYYIPSLKPYSMNNSHLEHHSIEHFATADDPDYLPFHNYSVWQKLKFCLIDPILLPAFSILRYSIIYVAGLLSPSVRDSSYKYYSSTAFNPGYEWHVESGEEIKLIQRHELYCFLFIVGAGIFLALGLLPVKILLYYYVLQYLLIVCKNIETLLEHNHNHSPGGSLTLQDQYLDANNFPYSYLAEILMPVGMRFHALHHLFRRLPYHALPEAHRRLVAQLSPDSPYHLSNHRSALKVLKQNLFGKPHREFKPDHSAQALDSEGSIGNNSQGNHPLTVEDSAS